MAICAQDIMKKEDIARVGPNAAIGELDRILAEREVSGVPVINDKGELVGVVSQSDIVRFINKEMSMNLNYFSYIDKPEKLKDHSLDEELKSRQVWEIMQTRLHTVEPETDIPTVARILRKHHIHRVLVTRGKRMVGIITAFDLVRLLEDPKFLKEFWDGPGEIGKAGNEKKRKKLESWTPFRK